MRRLQCKSTKAKHKSILSLLSMIVLLLENLSRCQDNPMDICGPKHSQPWRQPRCGWLCLASPSIDGHLLDAWLESVETETVTSFNGMSSFVPNKGFINDMKLVLVIILSITCHYLVSSCITLHHIVLFYHTMFFQTIEYD